MTSVYLAEWMMEWATQAEVLDYDPENRDSQTRDTDKQVGDVSELAFAELLEAFGVKYRWAGEEDDYDDYDFQVYSRSLGRWLTVDVKCRKAWRGYTDLIVQTGRNGDKCTDIVVQALVNEDGTKVDFTGYATRSEVLSAEVFGGARGEYRRQVKRLVEKDDLNELKEAFPEFAP